MASPTSQVLLDIRNERRRQDQLRAAGRFAHTCASIELTGSEKLAILTEEVGEVARECLAQGSLVFDRPVDTEALRKELVQVAAIATAWVEGIDADAEGDHA